jgi:hypothetical protein
MRAGIAFYRGFVGLPGLVVDVVLGQLVKPSLGSEVAHDAA